MKKVVISSLIVLMVVGVGLVLAENDKILGNGAPQSKLLGKLNIIGVKSDKDKNVNMEDKDAGSVIFVGLGAEGEPDNTEISLIQGEDFAVLDKNGTDGEAAFQMPPTGLDPYIVGDKGSANTMSEYSVFIRARGTPGGKATMMTCAEVAEALGPWLTGKTGKVLSDPEVGDTVCSMEVITSTILVRNSSKPKFINVTAELLTILFQVTMEDGTVYIVRVPLFSDLLEGYYWSYDNEGLKNCEIRFYDCPTDVSANDPT
jgi:hypothetical protein